MYLQKNLLHCSLSFSLIGFAKRIRKHKFNSKKLLSAGVGGKIGGKNIQVTLMFYNSAFHSTPSPARRKENFRVSV